MIYLLDTSKIPLIISHAHHAHVLLFLPYTVLSQSVLLWLRFIHNSGFSPGSASPQITSLWLTSISQCTMPRQRRNRNRCNAVLKGLNTTAEIVDFCSMSTEALHLLLWKCHPQQSSNRRELILQLQWNAQPRRPPIQLESAPTSFSVANGVPHAELAALITSVVDKRMNCYTIQHGRASNAQLTQPSPSPNRQERLRPSTTPPPEDGGQPNTTCQQLPFLHNPPNGNLLPNTATSGLASLSSSVTFPIQPKSCCFTQTWQPSLTSHLTMATSTDFATLLPMTSILTDTIHSHLNLLFHMPPNHVYQSVARCLHHPFCYYSVCVSLLCCWFTSLSTVDTRCSKKIPCDGLVHIWSGFQ